MVAAATEERPPDEPKMYRRKLKSKPKFESGPSYFSLKRVVPGAFSVDLRVNLLRLTKVPERPLFMV